MLIYVQCYDWLRPIPALFATILCDDKFLYCDDKFFPATLKFLTERKTELTSGEI